MEVLLTILGVLGFCAILVVAYIFTTAAGHNAPQEGSSLPSPEVREDKAGFTIRSPRDRRTNSTTEFPMIVDSILIEADRRRSPDRRAATA
ncbi:MAG: hypothetical protein AAGF57_07865 [Pseudomonadota bacterium]